MVNQAAKAKKKKGAIPLVKLDPAQMITLMNKVLKVLQPGFQIEELVGHHRGELADEEHDEMDLFVFEEWKVPVTTEVVEISNDDMPMPPPVLAKGKGKSKGLSFVAAVSSALKGKGSMSAIGSAVPKGPPKDNWKHDVEYVRCTVELLMPPPIDLSLSVTMTVQHELKTMLKEQEKASTSEGGLKELGWYMPQEFMGDNLFQWIVEMHLFDEMLPIAKDLKRECVLCLNSATCFRC
ncbi:hypothetical protein K438DRAFT_2140935 [Mycena galopus ATCC 62051]|nr:hypothetical protein K438DRAFT_2140935 [Mycena galopus ATCC 62051]